MSVAQLGFLLFVAACQPVDGAPRLEPSTEPGVSTTPSGSAATSADAAPLSPALPSAVGQGLALPTSAPSASASTEPEEPPPCPAEMALVGRFCVDRHEASLALIESDGSERSHPHYERPSKGARYKAHSLPNVFPQGYISRVEAESACKEAGKRLCSRGEWQTACRGKGFARYPYGHQGKRGTCNTAKDHLLTVMFEKEKKKLKYDEHFNSPRLNQEPGFLAKNGEYQGCVSHLGVSDMVGNLHEWVTGMVDQDLVDKLEGQEVQRRKQPWVTGNGIFMGGFYSTTSEHGAGCEFITIAHEPSYHDYSTGFRCCKAAELPKPAAKPKTKPRPKPGASAATPPLAPHL